MNPQDVIAPTRKYIKDNFLYARPDAHLDGNELFLETGIVDSMGMVELVVFLNDEFGVELEDEEITEANLGSLSRIATFVLAKRARAAA